MSDNLIIQRSPSGGYLAVPTTSSTAESLRYAPDANRKAYMQKVFTPKESTPETQSEAFKKRFITQHTSTSCFYCQDSKLQSRNLTMPNGATYRYSFACLCSMTENKQLTSINVLKEKLWCTLGGKHGLHCPLDNNAACRNHHCPKFETSYDRQSDTCNDS